eukprot:1141071-Pelagomonas_calceolata.AAC.1
MRAGFPDTTSSADRNTKQPTLRATLTAYLHRGIVCGVWDLIYAGNNAKFVRCENQSLTYALYNNTSRGKQQEYVWSENALMQYTLLQSAI